jgi:FMN-dependent NADH-azoreductase
MKIGIYDHLTGEQEVRDMTAEEVANIEANVIAAAEKQAAKEAQAEAKAAVLEKLGLTAEEVAALLA